MMDNKKKEKPVIGPNNIRNVGRDSLDMFNSVKCKKVGF
jgi:hypothetical protein